MEMIVRRAFSYSSKQSVSLGNQVVLNVHSVIKVITESLLMNRVFLQNLGGVLALGVEYYDRHRLAFVIAIHSLPKVRDQPYVLTLLNKATTFEWYIARLVVKNGH